MFLWMGAMGKNSRWLGPHPEQMQKYSWMHKLRATALDQEQRVIGGKSGMNWASPCTTKSAADWTKKMPNWTHGYVIFKTSKYLGRTTPYHWNEGLYKKGLLCKGKKLHEGSKIHSSLPTVVWPSYSWACLGTSRLRFPWLLLFDFCTVSQQL